MGADIHARKAVRIIFATTAAVMLVLISAGCGSRAPVRVEWQVDARYTLSGISAISDNEAWAAGENGTVLHYRDGAWQKEPSGTASDLSAVFALDREHVWAVGGEGTILFFNGDSWSPRDSGVEVELTGVFALDKDDAWAVGWGGTILYFNGRKWSRQRSGEETLRSVYAAGGDSAWAVGSNGTVLHYDGKKWKPQDSGTNIELTGIYAVSGGEAWVCGLGGTVLSCGGGTWKNRRSGDELLRGIGVDKAGSVWVAGFSMNKAAIDPGSHLFKGPGGWEEVEVSYNLYPTGIDVKAGTLWLCGEAGAARGEIR